MNALQTPVFRIRNLSFAFGREPAVSIDDLDLESGIIHVILGPNGSGKTTLLKLLNRLLAPQEGRIEFKGGLLDKNNEVREKTVYLHQNPLLLKGTVYDNVAFGLKVRGVTRRDAAPRVEEALELVGMSGFDRRRSSGLSGGEVQRVAIARAIVLRPEVLLLDEPTSSVDRENVGRIEELLHAIRDDLGCTVIISTHDLPFAFRTCDSLVRMDEGRIADPHENILRGYVSSRYPHYLEFTSGGIPAVCPHIDGDFRKAVIDYDQIIISTHAMHSSARNCLRGRIAGVKTLPTGQADVSVRLGGGMMNEPPEYRPLSFGKSESAPESEGLTLVSRVTDSSVDEMGLKTGKEVWLAFKASSVRLY